MITELEQLQSILALLETKGNGKAEEGPADAGEMAALLAQIEAGKAPISAQPPIRRSRRGTKPGRDGRAPQGANKQRIIEAVLDDPGVTATEIAERTGVKRTVVSATLNRLKRNGELEAYGRGVRVPLVPAGSPEPVAVG